MQISLDQLSLEVFAYIDDGNEDRSEPIEIRKSDDLFVNDSPRLR